MYHSIDKIQDIPDIIELYHDKVYNCIEYENNFFKMTLEKSIELLDFETDVPEDNYISDLIFYLDELDIKKDDKRLEFFGEKYENGVFYFWSEVK